MLSDVVLISKNSCRCILICSFSEIPDGVSVVASTSNIPRSVKHFYFFTENSYNLRTMGTFKISIHLSQHFSTQHIYICVCVCMCVCVCVCMCAYMCACVCVCVFRGHIFHAISPYLVPAEKKLIIFGERCGNLESWDCFFFFNLLPLLFFFCFMKYSSTVNEFYF